VTSFSTLDWVIGGMLLLAWRQCRRFEVPTRLPQTRRGTSNLKAALEP
jgi:hypothetical protein